MQLFTIRNAGRSSAAVALGTELIDIAGAAEAVPAARALPASLRGILECGDEGLAQVRRVMDQVAGNDALADWLRESGALLPREKAKLLAPIPNPGFVLSAGMNYHAHLKEMKSPPPETPAHFAKNVAAIIGTGAAIRLPASNPNMVDWEGEFCAVIGSPCHAVSEGEAMHHVVGYTLINDVSARDWVTPIAAAQGTMGPIMAWEHNLLGKQFPTFCPMGPAVVTADEIRDPNDVDLQTVVNGKVMQSTNTSDLVFNVARLIAYYSRFYLLQPGDVITTGSPAGVGFGRDPKVFLRTGDTVSVSAHGIGTLTNPVVGPGAR
ncbi:MAG TPA: fumarylacetoacetate hydrolase family protein [Stellaceae bacterium]|nr:fumarylacetoacetate hydrolase family protein [Stellaceae bacterium]